MVVSGNLEATTFRKRRKGLLADLLLLGLVLVLAVAAFHKQAFLRPMGIHAWAKTDRLAVAYQLHDHENNPLINRTWTNWAKDRRVGTEFPLQAWMAATGGRILGRDAIPPLMRFVTLLPVLAGLWLMACFIRTKTGSAVPASAFVVFSFGAPVLLSYAADFMPDAFALGLVLCGFYFLFRYWDTFRYRDFVWAMVFFGVAAVCKISAFWFVSAGLSVFWLWWHNRERIGFWQVFIPQVVVVVFFLLNIAKMKYDQERFNSSVVFMAELRPLDSPHVLKAMFKSVWQFWWWQYLVPLAYAALLFLGGAYLVSRPGKLKGHHTVWLVSYLVLLAAFLVALGMQLRHHDYYTLVPLFPLLLIGVAFFLVRLWRRLPLAVLVFGAASVVAAMLSIRQNHARNQEEFFVWKDRTRHFVGADKYFPPEERYQDKILSLWEKGSNMVQHYAQKPGYYLRASVLSGDTVRAVIEMDSTIRYVIYANDVEGQVLGKAGETLKDFSPYVREEKFTIVKRW